MQNVFDVLEFSKIKKEVSLLSTSEKGKTLIEHMKFLTDYDELVKELNTLDEMIVLLFQHGTLPLSNSLNLDSILDIAKKGGILTELELDHVVNDCQIANKLITYFKKLDDKFLLLKEVTNKLTSLDELINSIRKVIKPDLTIYDNASKNLYSIRSRITRLEHKSKELAGSLLSKYQDLLSESVVAYRDGHLVLPFKTAYKNKINGLVFGVSDSGATTFIEPQELVSINNELFMLKKEELEEIRKILRELTKLLINYENELSVNNAIIAYIDYVSAKAKYAISNDMIVAKTSKEKHVNLLSAKHPLINKEVVVSNDIQLTKEKHLILISGPNAGGKTVALKTLGLCVLMHQSGLAIPVREGSELCIFTNVFVDIGDSQSLENALSTFSGHISNISNIVNNVTENDLVLLDEIGTGTSPLEGEALAVSMCSFLIKERVFALVSSHFDGLKVFALNNPSITNASMLFDEEKLKPLYIMKMGLPGRSYGLDMAKRYNLDDEIINTAKDYLVKAKSSGVNNAISELANIISTYENKVKELINKENDYNTKINDYIFKKEKLDLERKAFKETLEQEKDEYILNVKKEVDELISSLTSDEIKPHKVNILNKQLDDLIYQQSETKNKTEEEVELIKLNDLVEIEDLNIKGKVVRISKNNVELMSGDGFRYKSTLDRVKKLSNTTKTVVKKSHANIDNIATKSVPMELNIIGKRSDEAVILVGQYLDMANLKKVRNVRIIHGFGTGALRKAIHDYLKRSSIVKSYNLGDTYEGGAGATVVHFYE